MFKTLHPNIRIRIYTSFLSRVIGSMIFPFMAIYFTLHINATAAGIFLMIHVAVQFIASLYGGYLADLIGRKKMMVIGEWMKVFAFLGMVLTNSPFGTLPILTFIMMLIVGVASGFVNPAAEAMLIDVSTKETRSFMYSINYWAVNLSIMLGLIVGGWFYKTHLFELLISLFIMSIITLWMTAALIKETYKKKEGITKKEYGFKPIIQSYKTVIKDLPFIWFTLGGIAILSLEFQRNNFIAVRLEKEFMPTTYDFWNLFDVSLDGVKLLSLLTVENTIIIILFTAIVSKWIKNKQEKPLMYIGFTLFGLGYAILAFSNSLWLLFTAVIILSIGELLYVPTRQSLLAAIVDDTKRGAYMAFNGFVFQFGKLFGALGIIVGGKIGGYGMASLYIVFILLGIILSQFGLQHRKQQETVQPSIHP